VGRVTIQPSYSTLISTLARSLAALGVTHYLPQPSCNVDSHFMRFRYALFVAGLYSILLFLPSLTIGQTNVGLQVVFSWRVYKERGPSFQQIWSWNPVSGALRALTQSPRDHLRPKCDNGKITFVSGVSG
jgi:hypothetical protein